jgi:uncharacterized protein YjbI with pentapeptide repeats
MTDHYAEYEQEATKRFEELVKDSISQNKPLECFGYYLPDINFANLLEGKSIAQPIYFMEAIFYKEADFTNVNFPKEASFWYATFSKGAYFGATFSKEADFTGATFSEGAEFSEAKFSEGADFLKAGFSKHTSFSEATFSKASVFSEAKFSKEADFTGATFSEGADFSEVTFFEKASFHGTNFSKHTSFFETTFSKDVDFETATFKGADFTGAKFLAECRFLNTQFGGETRFRYTLFEQQNKVVFDNSILAKVSFADSDITKIRFGDKIRWGGKDKFMIMDEEELRNKAKGNEKKETNDEENSMELVLSVYRNLRENYEFRLRYDDAGKFFVKEMELKRKFREIETENGTEIKANCWFRRHFSLTGLYYHLSNYGESISKPAAIGAITVLLATLFWVTQSNPTLEPHFDASLVNTGNSTFVGLREVDNSTQWLEGFERSLAGFIPLLSLGGETKVGIIDYIIKIFGGGLTFVLLAIALRRKFERKYTR